MNSVAFPLRFRFCLMVSIALLLLTIGAWANLESLLKKGDAFILEVDKEDGYTSRQTQEGYTVEKVNVGIDGIRFYIVYDDDPDKTCFLEVHVANELRVSIVSKDLHIPIKINIIHDNVSTILLVKNDSNFTVTTGNH